MVRLLGFAFASFLLTSCATVLEEPAQDLTIDIVGTGEALCDVTQKGRRYRAHAPGTIRVMKSQGPMKVKCMAPGNRDLEVTLTPEMSDMMFANVVTGVVPGVTWDYLSGASHQYPDRVVMDFTNMMPQPFPLPDYQKILERNPSIAGMEQFRDGKSALISDIGRPSPQMTLREDVFETDSLIMEDVQIIAPPSSVAAPQSFPTIDGQGFNADMFDSPDK